MMKKILLILLLALTLTGCKTVEEIKPDTIVDIPLHPTETEAVTEKITAPTETEPRSAETEAPTQTPTQPQGNSGSGRKGSSGSGSRTQATQPPADPPTEAPTEAPTPAATEPPVQPPTEAPAAYDPSGYTAGSLDRAVAAAVNAQREAAGLPPLAVDERLCAIASVRARELSVVWSHTRPDGTSGLTVLSQYGYGCAAAAENLYYGAWAGEAIVEKWMSSKSTAANVLMEESAVIGVGSYTDEDGLTYVAAIFAG